MIGQNKVHQEVTSNGVSSDYHVATIKKNEKWIEDLILINLNVNKYRIQNANRYYIWKVTRFDLNIHI